MIAFSMLNTSALCYISNEFYSRNHSFELEWMLTDDYFSSNDTTHNFIDVKQRRASRSILLVASHHISMLCISMSHAPIRLLLVYELTMYLRIGSFH
jgi:hypothetical protein